MRTPALLLVPLVTLAAAGPAAAATATWIDSPTDNPGGPEIIGIGLDSDGLYLSGNTLLGDNGIILPGDALAWYVDSDNNRATGDPAGGFEWRIAYQISSFSGNPIGGASRWGGSDYDFAAPSPPSFTQTANSDGDFVTWRVALSELGVAANGTVRVHVTAAYQGRRDRAPDEFDATHSFNVQTGEVAPAPPVAEALAAIRPPRLTGKPKVGGLVRCSTGTWSGSPARFVITWQRALRGGRWGSIGRRARAYSPRAADAGRAIRCQVKAFAGGRSATARSKAVRVPIPPR